MPCRVHLHVFYLEGHRFNSWITPIIIILQKLILYVTDDVQGTQITVESKTDKVLPLWTSQENAVFEKVIITVSCD